MELTVKDKALIRCRLDNNLECDCSKCEINEECDWGSKFDNLAKELLLKLDIKWSMDTNTL